MVYVPSAERFGFSLRLNEDVMRDVMNSPAVRAVLGEEADQMRTGIVSHVQATASADDAANYVASIFDEEGFSDEYGFDFNGSFELGNRPIHVIGVPAGRGVNPDAKPPLMVEAETHALTSQMGTTVGGVAEDIR